MMRPSSVQHCRPGIAYLTEDCRSMGGIAMETGNILKAKAYMQGKLSESTPRTKVFPN